MRSRWFYDSLVHTHEFDVIVIGGGHAGAEAAWAAANVLASAKGDAARGRVTLVTMDPTTIGVMSCNPAIGGLAKGQLVREIDALGGLMGLAADATGIQFKVLNQSRGPAVHGPRAQCDKHAYAECVQRLIAAREEIVVIAGSVERVAPRSGGGVEVQVCAARNGQAAEGLNGQLHAKRGDDAHSELAIWPFDHLAISAPAAVLTTGTFMRALMHTGERKTSGGRAGEGSAESISGALRELGFELGRLKTGTPPRLRRSSIRWDDLTPALGDAEPTAFSDLSHGSADDGHAGRREERHEARGTRHEALPSLARFPVLPQVDCRETSTCAASHALIRANLHRAPMFSGQIESMGPRYCPSIEDKVVRFAERESHTVFLEPESLRAEGQAREWIYCNGISTSLPIDVQEDLVRSMPGCEKAEILRHGYAVEYDMVRPHQILATGETRLVPGLYLAGQINGTSGYEEAAAQGLVAGLNAARRALGQSEVVIARDQAYIGVLMDDLVTKTPVEPYRMFTSRAEHRLLLRSDNSADRLTPRAMEWGLLPTKRGDREGLAGELGSLRRLRWQERTRQLADAAASLDSLRIEGLPARQWIRRSESTFEAFEAAIGSTGVDRSVWLTLFAAAMYEPFIERQRAEVRRLREWEHRALPREIDYGRLTALRAEARESLRKFKPATLGQALRLEGMTPADVTLLAVLL